MHQNVILVNRLSRSSSSEGGHETIFNQRDEKKKTEEERNYSYWIAFDK